MAEFDKSIFHVLKNEGGFIDDPDDPGGATNYGLSRRWLTEHGIDLGRGPGIITVSDVKVLTLDLAKQLYYDHFWRPYCFSWLLDQVVATKVFDMTVNMGSVQAFKLVRNALIDYREWDLPRTGLMDEALLEALNSIQPYRSLPAIIKESIRFYQVLAHVKPRQAKFLPGWIKRASWPPEDLMSHDQPKDSGLPPELRSPPVVDPVVSVVNTTDAGKRVAKNSLGYVVRRTKG